MNVSLCPHCGTTNRAGSNFCNRCGANLQSDDRREERPAESQESGGAAYEEAPPSPFDPESEGATDQPRALAERRRRPEPPLMPPEPALDDDTPFAADTGEAAPFTRRLVMGVQELLEPVQIANALHEGAEPGSALVATALTLPAEQLRRIRALLTDDPVLLDPPALAVQVASVRWRLPWLILLVSGALALPILFGFFGPVGAPQQWPGVAEAHALIDSLPAGATVLMLWEYDAATAGELDLVALPLVSHLLERRIQPIFVSQLPGGPAVAERLLLRAAEGLRADTAFQFITDRELYINAGYLPGGAAALTYVAQAPASALVRHSPLAPVATPLTTETVGQAALTIVVAAQAEAVQQWLEQGQPVQQRPTLAVTSAGADPILRPYLASGQLRGLVSGFDGAISYQQLRTVHLAVAEEAWMSRQLVLQNWGHFALLLILFFGNLVAWGKGGRRG